MKKHTIILAICILNSLYAHAQIPISAPLQWQRCMGTPYDDYLYKVIDTHDNGFACVGDKNGRPVLYKVDSAGNVLIEKRFPSMYGDGVFISLLQTPDHGFVCVGRTNDITIPNNTSYDLYIVRTDSTGNVLWEKIYGGTADDIAYDVILDHDGNPLVVGETKSNDYDLAGIRFNYTHATDWQLKVDINNGNILRNRITDGFGRPFIGITPARFTTNYWVLARHLQGLADWTGVFKLDSVGNPIYRQWYYSNQAKSTIPNAILATPDGGCLVAMTIQKNDTFYCGTPPAYDGFVMRLDSAGDVLWRKCFTSGTNKTEYLSGLCASKTDSNIYYISGSASRPESSINDMHFWLIKIDGEGNNYWQQTYGSTTVGTNYALDNCYSLACNATGAVAMCGRTNMNNGQVSGNHGLDDGWLIKIKDFTVSTKDLWHTIRDLNISPLPDHQYLIQLTGNDTKYPATATLTDVLGRTVRKITIDASPYTIDLTNDAQAVYLLKINGYRTAKLVR